MSLRTEKIAEEIRRELSRLIREEARDPRMGLLTLTRVKVSPDLSTAVVFFSPLSLDGESSGDQMAEGLQSAAGFFRSRLAATLSLRRTPALSFRHDRSIELGSRTIALLRGLPELQKDQPAGMKQTSEVDRESAEEQGHEE